MYKLVHNGGTVLNLDSVKDVEGYIKSTIEPYKHLLPEKVMDRTFYSIRRGVKYYTRIVRYKYAARLYEELFIIDSV